jgi:hypothetical protein
MRRALAIVMCAALPTSASAQDDFSRLKAKLGQIVYVTDGNTGIEVSGPLTGLSPSELSIDGYRFEPQRGMKIERRGDSLWNGAAIGFGLGAVLAVCTFACGDQRIWVSRLESGLFWAGIGTLIDHEHVGRTTIFDRSSDALGRSSTRLVPVIDAHRKAIAVVRRF